MDREQELAVVRAAYAKQILAEVEVRDAALEAAFAAVRRENFLGPGPWAALRAARGYCDTPSDDPVYLYTDGLFGIVAERRLNNGQPSLHAWLLHKAAPRPGEHVVHVGAGVGYYTAIMAKLVGPGGRVTGIEFDPDLAARAKANFALWPNVEILAGDGATVPFDPADVVYVNAGATQPAPAWLDRLKESGRLILPLTTTKGFGEVDPRKMAFHGGVFLVTRHGDAYDAKWISPVAIFPCEGNRHAAAERALAGAFEKGAFLNVSRLRRDPHPRAETCWLHGDVWCLAG
ncbi:MAG: methyltransferase domain-containing protein [Rhizomicrobium sp.]